VSWIFSPIKRCPFLIAVQVVRPFELGNSEEGIDLLMKAREHSLEGPGTESFTSAAHDLLETTETENGPHLEKDAFMDYAILCIELQDWEKCLPDWEREVSI
jgi:hypothetical protein